MFHVEQDLAVEIRFGTANCSMWNILPPIGNQHVPRGTRQNQLILNCGVLELVCDAN